MSKFNIEDAAHYWWWSIFVCVETAMNMQRMANIEKILTLEQQSNMQSLG